MTSLLSPRNKIAYCEQDKETGSQKVCLNLSNIQKIIQSFSQPNTEDFPVGVITVLGSETDNYLRGRLTDCFTSTYSKSLDKQAISHSKQMECLNLSSHEISTNKVNNNQGIFLWPRPLSIPEGSTQRDKDSNIIICILFAPFGSNNLDNFAALASTKIVVTQEEEKKSILDFIGSVKGRDATDDTTVQVFDTKWMKFMDARALALRTEKFLKGMGEKPIPALKDFSGKQVSLGKLEQYLTFLTEALNKSDEVMQETKVPQSDQVKPTIQSKTDSHPIPNSKPVKPPVPPRTEKSQDKMNSLKFVQTTTEKLKTSSGTANNMDIGKILTDWLDNTFAGNNFEELFPLFEKSSLTCKHVQEVVESATIFQAHMTNMYDNYICFHGESDKKQMQRFHSSAYATTTDSFRKKCPNPLPWQTDFLRNICERLMALVNQDNEKILLSEEYLAETVMNRILNHYETKMDIYLPNSNEEKGHCGGLKLELEEIHKRMSSQCLTILQECLDYLGRNNNVLVVFTDKLHDKFTQMSKVFCQKQQNHYMNSLPIRHKPEFSAGRKLPPFMSQMSLSTKLGMESRSPGDHNSLPVGFSKKQQPPAPSSLSPSSLRADIMKKCSYIRQQIQEKKVRVGVLLHKLVLEAVSKFETLAEDQNTTDKSILSANMELNSLIQKYGF